MFKKILLTLCLVVTVFISGCSSEDDKQLRLVVNPWIGYSPLFYLEEIGVLDELNIKLIHSVSLTNSAEFFATKDIELVAGTQYEYSLTKSKGKDITPIILLDRSYGGDVIMSNKPLEFILGYEGQIDAYLEIQSINKVLLDSFLEEYQIYPFNLNLINIDQSKMASLYADSLTTPSLLVTYTPYDVSMRNKGFNMVASTSTNENLLIVDAIFSTPYVLENHEERLMLLKKHIDNAIEELNKNPQNFYNLTKYYLDGISYEDFLGSVDKIQWINVNQPDDLLRNINKTGFTTHNLIE